jgi:hypothetical protein
MGATLTSITGLQNCVNLQEFRADWNSLTTVNLSGLSNLTYVDISDNDVPGSGTNSLTSLNVTGCTAIVTLNIDDNNFSAGLPDLTPLTSLVTLDLDQCGITGNLDISQLSSTLESIDLSGNTGITSVLFPSASITNLDLSNTALTQTAVNNTLMWINGNGLENGNLSLHNGTSSHPSSEFLIHKTQLEGKGWNVNINQPPPGYVGIAASTDFDIVGDFTIEMFVNMQNTDGYPRPYSFGAYPAPNAISIEGGTLYFWANESTLLNGTFDPTLNQWYHIAVMGVGSNVYLFVDGTQIATTSVVGGINISSQGLPLTIGYGNEANSGFNGKMSNFRWANEAIYSTTGFTVPTSPLTATEDTVLLTFQGTNLNAQLLDNSGNGHNATASGATYSASNPFTGVSGSLQMGSV